MTVATKSTTSCHVRWMIRRDMERVLEIEQLAFQFPWREEDFTRCLRQRNCIGMVAESLQTDDVLGFMLYELHKTRLHLLNLAVHPYHWRRGVGKSLVGKLASKLHVQRRRSITCEVRESNLDAQLFFKAMGFLAVNVLRDFYDPDETAEDAIAFQRRVQEEPA